MSSLPTIIYPPTPVVSAKERAAARAAAQRERALASLAHNTVGERKVAAKEFGLRGRWATVTVLAPSNRGRNARGTTGAKRGYGPGSVPKGASRARKQNTHVRGARPRLAATRWNNV